MEELKDHQKVSLIFYSEEDGKKVMKDKWSIEIGKKYKIGRSKKKADISIEDISISRVQAEIIFYNTDKIMVKDCDSSNGTYINRQRIKPLHETYFSSSDVLSIGSEQNELIFDVPESINKERKLRDDFDFNEKKERKNYENNYYNYLKKNENKINIKNKSKSFSRNSSYNKNYRMEKDKDYGRDDREDKWDKSNREDKDKYNKYNREDKYSKYDEEDKYIREDKNNKTYNYNNKEDRFNENNIYTREAKSNKYNEEDNNYKYEKYKKDENYDNFNNFYRDDEKEKNIKYNEFNEEKKDNDNYIDDNDNNRRYNKKDNYRNKNKQSYSGSGWGSSGNDRNKYSNNKYNKYTPKAKTKITNKNWKNKYSPTPSNTEKKYRVNSSFKGPYRNKKNKCKNVSSYIIKKDSAQEEEFERENDKRQIALYNEYLKTKREKEENNQKKDLPSLLPLLITRLKEKENNSYDEDEDEDENIEDDYDEGGFNEPTYNRIVNIKALPRRIRVLSDYGRSILGIKRRRKYIPRFLGSRL